VKLNRERATTQEWKHSTNSTESLQTEDTLQGRMLDHTDGLEAAAVGKKRMLEGHPGGPQGEAASTKSVV